MTRRWLDWTLSHLALSDHILGAAACVVLASRPAVVDNREAMERMAVESLARRNAANLVAVVTAIPGHAVGVSVQLRLVNRDGQPVLDWQLPWSELIHLRAAVHLPDT
ncbi:hypothetical protein [Streptomyces sp. 6N106]|uniref:hypothetical protein n=1 Tax=Streptomyces sp. 6N106 TaxID=3457418 RepID=UPI003FD3797C